MRLGRVCSLEEVADIRHARQRFPDGATVREIEMVYLSRFNEFCSVANAVLHDREQAKDAVQDAFVSALSRRSQWRGEGSLDSWLWRAVLNAARDRRRKHEAIPVSDTAAAARLEPSVSFDGSAGAAGAVVDALTGLTERQRLVLFLRYYGDLDYGQIAETLGLKPGTVAATIHQAQEHLRNRLRVAVDD
jgi:RNA polymerase sigma-70 factor (ECF subfamily)